MRVVFDPPSQSFVTDITIESSEIEIPENACTGVLFFQLFASRDLQV